MVAGLTAQQAGHESSPSRWRVRCAIYDVDNCGAISRNHLELEGGERWLSERWNSEILANFLGEHIDNFSVTRNGGSLIQGRIVPLGMPGAFSELDTPLFA